MQWWGRLELEVQIPSGSGYRFEGGNGLGFRFGDKVGLREGFRFDAV